MTRPAAPSRTAALSRRRRRATPDADPRPSPGNITPGTRDYREGAEATVTIGPVSDALDKLLAEHRLLKALFQRGTARSLPRLRDAFDRHVLSEGKVFHPAVRRAAGKEAADLLDRAARAHELAAGLLDRLEAAPVAQRASLARALRQVLEEHMKVEESEVHPVALRVLGRPERVRLGEEMDLLQARRRKPRTARGH